MLIKKYILLFLLLICFLYAIPLHSQQNIIELTHYGMEEGLSHREAHVIFEDREGFIWIGTKYGLNRFDGEEFKWYNQSKKGFSFNHISRIAQDDEGWLWLWNDRGFVFFHPKSEKIQTVEERFGKDIFFEKELEKSGSWKYWETAIVPKDSNGKLYLSSMIKNECITYDTKTGFKNHIVEDTDSLELRYVSKNGEVFFRNKNVLLVFDSNFNFLDKKVYDNELSIENIWKIEGKNYIVSKIKREERDNTLAPEIKGNHITIGYVQDVLLNPISKTIWFYNSNTWSVLDLEGKQITALNKKEALQKPNHIFADSKGRVWLASDIGISLMELVDHPFSFYFNRNKDFPLNSSVRGIWSDGKYTYANLEKGGFFQVDNNGDWKLLDQSLENKGEQSKSHNVDYWGRSLLKDKKGLFWIGGKRSLRSYDSSTGNTRYFYTKNYKDKHTTNEYIIDIWSIHEEKKGFLWLGTGNGLCYKKSGDDFISKMPVFKDFPEFSESIVLHIYKENDDLLYLCTNRGLYLFNTEKKQITKRYWIGGDEEYFLPESDIQHIYKDKDGSYWLSSISGLIHWKKEQKEYEIFDRRNGFPDNNIYGVLEDHDDNLWMGTDRGLVQFNKKSHAVRIFSSNDGLSFSEFNRISLFQAENGRMFFGGMNGVISLDACQFAENNKKIAKENYKMQITEILVFDEENNKFQDITSQYWDDGKLMMNRSSSFFNINFTMLNYGKYQNNRYQYKIEGINHNWIDIDESNIQLNRLPYGTYQLKIKGFYTGSLENEQRLNLVIIVPPPFYFTLWFMILTLGTIIALFFFVFRQRAIISEKRQRVLEKEIEKANKELSEKYTFISNQKEQLQEANRTKDQIFAILGHDLRKPANAFRGVAKRVNYLIRKKDFDTLEKVSQGMERDALGLNTLTDNLLNWALTERNTLPHHEESIDIKGIIDEVFLTMERLAKDKKIVLLSEIKENTLVLADRNSLLIIIRNLVDNAIKFTPEGGRISIHTTSSKTNTILTIQDTGIGIPLSKIDTIFVLNEDKITKGTEGEKGTGLGLHLVQKLVKRNNGTIKMESILEVGTTFIVNFSNAR